jgi:hypothetical protein
MIDRATRKRISDAIRSYLNEEITSFQFDYAIQELGRETKDVTAQRVIKALWYYYDDFKDHKVVSTKEEWDYFHRILLLLESEGELEITKIRKWSLRQFVAAGALALFLLVAFRLGWGEYLFAVSIPFGVISILISFWHSKKAHRPNQMEIALSPFSSVREILSARRKVSVFHKKPYPDGLTKRKIRSPFMNKVLWLPSIVMWLMFAPVPLLFQAMPETVTKMKVRMA